MASLAQAKAASAEAWKIIGTEAMIRGFYRQAAYALKKALTVVPEDAASHHDLAACLIKLGRPNEALQYLKYALALQPGFPAAIGQLASIAGGAGCLREAVAGFEHALKMDPHRVGFWHDLATNYRELAEWDKSYAAHEKGIALAPDHADILSALIYTRDLDPRATIHDRFAARHRWHKKHRIKGEIPAPVFCRSGKIRVGFVSADFRIHSVAYAFSSTYFGLDRDKYEIYAYANNPTEDEWTERFKAHATKWARVTDLTDEQLIEKIKADQIDILVDLSGHTFGMRLRVFSAKPAPIQVHAFGYLMGTGIPEIDYILLDKVCGVQSELVERVVNLPCALAYKPPEWAPDVTPLPALANGFVTFGYLGRWSKVDDRTAELWGKILDAVPNSRLLLKDKAFGLESALDEAARRIGVSRDRIDFMGLTPAFRHMSAYGLVDISLDPTEQNGGVSALEASWMGVPSLCMLGDRVMARVCASIMTTLGLEAFVAADRFEYFERAVMIAKDLPRAKLAEIRGGLRDRMRGSSIANAPAYVAHVDKAFQGMIEKARQKAAA